MGEHGGIKKLKKNVIITSGEMQSAAEYSVKGYAAGRSIYSVHIIRGDGDKKSKKINK